MDAPGAPALPDLARLLPAEYAAYRPLLQAAAPFFLSRLPLARQQEILFAQLALPGGPAAPVRIVADYHRICAATGCDDVMLGRGAVADPLLARRIRDDRGEVPKEADWNEIRQMIAEFWTRVQAKVTPTQSPGRLKQWLGMMQRSYPQAERLFRALREARCGPEVNAILRRQGTARESPEAA